MNRPIRTGTDEAKYSRVLPARLADAFIIDSKRHRNLHGVGPKPACPALLHCLQTRQR
jgi:hypothetical protein